MLGQPLLAIRDIEGARSLQCVCIKGTEAGVSTSRSACNLSLLQQPSPSSSGSSQPVFFAAKLRPLPGP